VTGLVDLRLFRHHHFAIEQAPLIDDEFRSPDVPFDDRLPFEDNFLRRDDGASHFAPDRHVLGRYVPIDLSGDTDGETLACRDLTRNLTIDTDISLTSDLSLDDGSRADQVEFFDRISFQSLSSFRS
jgi:hypothetical protein